MFLVIEFGFLDKILLCNNLLYLSNILLFNKFIHSFEILFILRFFSLFIFRWFFYIEDIRTHILLSHWKDISHFLTYWPWLSLHCCWMLVYVWSIFEIYKIPVKSVAACSYSTC